MRYSLSLTLQPSIDRVLPICTFLYALHTTSRHCSRTDCRKQCKAKDATDCLRVRTRCLHLLLTTAVSELTLLAPIESQRTRSTSSVPGRTYGKARLCHPNTKAPMNAPTICERSKSVAASVPTWSALVRLTLEMMLYPLMYIANSITKYATANCSM